MSFVVPHKGNGAAKDGGTVQRQQRTKRIPALLLQALTTSEADGKEWNQDELLDTLYWMRQLLAVLCGVIWGAVPLKGLFSFFMFLAVFLGTPTAWLSRQGIDADEHGGLSVVHGEGGPQALGNFLLVWVVTHTILHS